MKKIFKQPAVLIYVVKNNKVLLAKKMKKINSGKYTGYGGKIEAGETELQAAQRELKQESGLDAEMHSLRKVALVDFYNTETNVWRVHVFMTSEFKGKPISTDEMSDPKWFDISKLPIDIMIWSDEYWLPVVLRGKKIQATIHLENFKMSIKYLKEQKN